MPTGAFQDTLSQATWAMMQEWMNKKSREAARQQMLEQAKLASAHQAEGGALDTQRILDELQATKEGAAFAKLLGISDQADPQASRTIDIIRSLMPGAVPEATTALQPGMVEGGRKMSAGMGDIIKGNFEGLDMDQLTRSMGGMENLLRMLGMGTNMQMAREELPYKQAMAEANTLRAEKYGTGGLDIAERQQLARMDNVIRTTRADVQRIAAKFTSTGAGSSFEAMLAAVMEIMPQTNMPEGEKKKYAEQWVTDVGPEFFGHLNGRINSIWTRFNKPGGPQGITDNEAQLIADAGNIYGVAEKFRMQKDDTMQAEQGRVNAEWVSLGQPEATAPRVADLMKADQKFKESIFMKTWEALYGVLPGVNDK